MVVALDPGPPWGASRQRMLTPLTCRQTGPLPGQRERLSRLGAHENVVLGLTTGIEKPGSRAVDRRSLANGRPLGSAGACSAGTGGRHGAA
jgi:hypothetical protein